jgi:hypothetical protein
MFRAGSLRDQAPTASRGARRSDQIAQPPRSITTPTTPMLHLTPHSAAALAARSRHHSIDTQPLHPLRREVDRL